ncbi:MAG TPA: anti-sigma factor [Chitinophagaceae bacterium]
MNIKDYISSGVVESYVLGLSTEDDKQEFEQLCARHPELVAARNEFEIALEKRLFNEASTPASGIKSRIMEAIRQDTSVNQTPIITMENRNNVRNSSPMRWIAVAAVILLLVSAYFAFNFYTRNKDLEMELARSRNAETEMNDKMKKLEDETRIMSDPNVAVVNMVGTQAPAKATANVYWDSTSSNVFLVVKNMPQLPSEKQYQLWALIDGQPKDLGLFDVGDNKKLILKMKNTQKADAFAITIETRGNTGGPTLEQMQSHGKASL